MEVSTPQSDHIERTEHTILSERDTLLGIGSARESTTIKQ
jgi:hypothetical protein